MPKNLQASPTNWQNAWQVPESLMLHQVPRRQSQRTMPKRSYHQDVITSAQVQIHPGFAYSSDMGRQHAGRLAPRASYLQRCKTVLRNILACQSFRHESSFMPSLWPAVFASSLAQSCQATSSFYCQTNVCKNWLSKPLKKAADCRAPAIRFDCTLFAKGQALAWGTAC